MKLSDGVAVAVLVIFSLYTQIETKHRLHDREYIRKYKRLHPKALRKIHNDVKRGAKLALDSCRKEFKNALWNCDVNITKVLGKERPVFAQSSLPATREGAYLQALGTASAMHMLTVNCRRGIYQGCSCVPVNSNWAPGGIWRWYGCNANLRFGETMTKHFIDQLEERSTDRARAVLNLHNNRVGRRVVRNVARKRCKCFGPTNSCQYIVCWTQLLNFSKVEEGFKKLYDNALQVKLVKNRIEPCNNSTGVKTVDDGHLAFCEKSPNYCKADETTGFPGMLGRKCFHDKCKHMCTSCGMQVGKVEVKVQKRESCTFKWCCSVTCKNVTERVSVGTCMQ